MMSAGQLFGHLSCFVQLYNSSSWIIAISIRIKKYVRSELREPPLFFYFYILRSSYLLFSVRLGMFFLHYFFNIQYYYHYYFVKLYLITYSNSIWNNILSIQLFYKKATIKFNNFNQHLSFSKVLVHFLFFYFER